MPDVRCAVCPHACLLKEGQLGRCGARRNENGKSVSVNYAQLTVLALDPVEKKPLYHFHPGSFLLSAGSFGCNMACPYCQNHAIAQAKPGEMDAKTVTPQELVNTALSLRPRGNIGVAFTYNEPMIGFEYVRDAAKLAKESGLCTAVITNGCVTRETLLQVLPHVDAFNVDLKCFTDAGYRALGGDLPTVKAFIETAVKAAHVEITALIAPGAADWETELPRMASWIASLSPDVPLHITRFFPRHRMLSAKPTDPALLVRLRDIAKETLTHVHLGNL